MDWHAAAERAYWASPPDVLLGALSSSHEGLGAREAATCRWEAGERGPNHLVVGHAPQADREPARRLAEALKTLFYRRLAQKS